MTKEELLNIARTSNDQEQLLTLSFGDIDCRIALLQNPNCPKELAMDIIQNLTEEEVTNNIQLLSAFKYDNIPNNILKNPNCPADLLFQDFLDNRNNYSYASDHPYYKRILLSDDLTLTDAQLETLCGLSAWYVKYSLTNIKNNLTLEQRYKIIDKTYNENTEEFIKITEKLFNTSETSNVLTSLAIYCKKYGVTYHTYKYLSLVGLLTEEDWKTLLSSYPLYKANYIDIVQIMEYYENIPYDVIKQIILNLNEDDKEHIYDILRYNKEYATKILVDNDVLSKLDIKTVNMLINDKSSELTNEIIYKVLDKYETIDIKFINGSSYKDDKYELFKYIVTKHLNDSNKDELQRFILNYDLSTINNDELIKLYPIIDKLNLRTPYVITTYYVNKYSVVKALASNPDVYAYYVIDSFADTTNSVNRLTELINCCNEENEAHTISSKFCLIDKLLNIDINEGISKLITLCTSYNISINSVRDSLKNKYYTLSQEQINTLQNSTISTDSCLYMLSNRQNIDGVSSNDVANPYLDNDKKSQMLADPSCPIEEIEKILNAEKEPYKADDLYYAIITNLAVSNELKNEAIYKFIMYKVKNHYNGKNYISDLFDLDYINSDNYNYFFDKFFNTEPLITEIHNDWKESNRIIDYFAESKYCTKDQYYKLMSLGYIGDLTKFEFTEDELLALAKKDKQWLKYVIKLDNCPKSALIGAIKIYKDSKAVQHKNMDTKTLDKIIEVCDPSYYDTLLCDKCSVKSILTMIKNKYDNEWRIVNILKNKEFTEDEINELVNMHSSLSDKIILQLPNINRNYLASLFE